MRLLTSVAEHWKVLLVGTVADWETCKVTHAPLSSSTMNAIFFQIAAQKSSVCGAQNAIESPLIW